MYMKCISIMHLFLVYTSTHTQSSRTWCTVLAVLEQSRFCSFCARCWFVNAWHRQPTWGPSPNVQSDCWQHPQLLHSIQIVRRGLLHWICTDGE